MGRGPNQASTSSRVSCLDVSLLFETGGTKMTSSRPRALNIAGRNSRLSGSSHDLAARSNVCALKEHIPQSSRRLQFPDRVKYLADSLRKNAAKLSRSLNLRIIPLLDEFFLKAVKRFDFLLKITAKAV